VITGRGRPTDVREDRAGRPAWPTESEVTQGDVQLVRMPPYSEPAPFGWYVPWGEYRGALRWGVVIHCSDQPCWLRRYWSRTAGVAAAARARGGRPPPLPGGRFPTCANAPGTVI
jgi:hypothetical protein